MNKDKRIWKEEERTEGKRRETGGKSVEKSRKKENKRKERTVDVRKKEEKEGK